MKAVGRRMFLYHTVCEVILYAYTGRAEVILDACEASAQAVQKMLNIYDKSSELSLLNQNYLPGIPYRISRELFNLLYSVWKFSRLCGGAFDMTVGSLVRLWDFTSPTPQIPSIAQVQETQKKCGYKQISFDEETCSVTIKQPGMVIDGGGFGKGYAVQKALECLKCHKVRSAVINYGGNLFLLGSYSKDERGEVLLGNKWENRKEEAGWKVGIQKPWEKRGESLGILLLKDLGTATSAGYERYFQARGRCFGHILNPTDGMPAESGLQSVTIISDSPLMTDLMSTAFFVLGQEKGDALAKEVRRYVLLEYVAVSEDGISLSEGARYIFLPVSDKAKG